MRQIRDRELQAAIHKISAGEKSDQWHRAHYRRNDEIVPRSLEMRRFVCSLGHVIAKILAHTLISQGSVAFIDLGNDFS